MALETGLLTYYTFDNTYEDEFGLGPTLTPTGSPTFNNTQQKLGTHSLNTGGHGTSGGSAFALFNGGTVFDMSTGSRTVAGWFWADNYTISPGIASNWANASGSGVVQWLFWHDSGSWKFQIRDASNVDHVITSGVSPVTGQWVFFALTYNSSGGGMQLRINGNSPGTATTPSVKSGINEVQFGSRNSAGAILVGMLDAIGVWSRVLTSGEIDELYNGGTGIQLVDTPTNDLKGLTLSWQRRDFRTTDEVESVQEDQDVDASTEYRASLYIDPEGDNDLVGTSPWDDTPEATFSRTAAIATAGGTLPPRGRISVETRHVFESETFEALQQLQWDFDISFADLANDTNFGILDDTVTSSGYTAPDTGTYTFRIGQDFAGGKLQAKINAGAFVDVITDTHHIGLLAGVTSGDTIVVKHTQTGSNTVYTMLTITPPSSTTGAFGLLRF